MDTKADNNDFKLFTQMIKELYEKSRSQLQFDQPITIRLIKDEENSLNPLGKTASYDPQNREINLYFVGRHPKDLMRSFSHELVHHAQNCRGDLSGNQQAGEGYAQADPHLREMEREAFEVGNMIFRDWEDKMKKEGVVPLFNNSPFATIQMGYKENLGENKMSKKNLNESHLRNIIRGVIQEMFDEDLHEDMVEDAPEETEAMAAGRAAQDEEPYEAGEEIGVPVKEDTGKEEEKHYRRNRKEDERHLAALKKDVEYDKKHEPLEEEEELLESFLPKGRDIRSNARQSTYNKLVEKWCK